MLFNSHCPSYYGAELWDLTNRKKYVVQFTLLWPLYGAELWDLTNRK